MNRNERFFRRAGDRPLLLSSLVGAALLTFAAANGCTGPEVPPAEEEDDGGTKPGKKGDEDAGIVDEDAGIIDEHVLTAVVAPIDDGNLDTIFELNGEGSQNPGGRAITYGWEVTSPGNCGGELADDAAPKTTFTPACRGEHTATLTVAYLDGSVTSEASQTFVVENRRPVVSGLALESAFLPGEDAVISATVSDEDAVDQPTCTARLAGDSEGDPAGLEIPSAPSADCRFVISTPPRVDTWKIEVVANDGFEDSLPATIEIKAGNDPPVIESVTADASSVGYACVDGACASEAVRVTVLATDDSDALEELVIALADVSEDAPEGVTVTATPVAGSPGVFDVVVGRADLGPLAGSYTLEASVTEVTAGEDGPATVTAQVSFDVTNAPPVIGTVTAADVPHAYASGSYTATVTVMATASDPEANALVTSIALVSCPTANAGQAACGGAGLSIEETASAGSLVLELETSSLVNLVGEYTFLVTATDAEGAVVTEQATLVVTNRAPALATGFQSSVEQSYNGSAHTALTPLFYDPDGDPLTYSLSVRCPNGSNIGSLNGSCSSGQSVSVNAATGVLTVTGPPTGLLGEYQITGTVSDGASIGNINATLTITNSPPQVVRRGGTASKTCPHRTTSGTTVRNDGCSYDFAGTGSDANGDPLTFRAFMENGSGYTATGTGFNGVAVPSNGQFKFSFGLETTYSNFVAKFNNQPNLIIEVTDPFGATGQVSWSPRLSNRAPELSWKNFHNKAGTGAPPDLHNDQQRFNIARKSWLYICYQGNCPSPPPPYELSLVIAATDPDGDPIEVELSVSCSGNEVVFSGGSPASTRTPLPSTGRFQLQVPGRLGQCSNRNRYREWHINSRALLPIGSGWEFSFGCRLSGANSILTDGIADVDLGEDVSFSRVIGPTSDLGCD